MMKTEQKNTKKIVVIIVAVLAILLAVAGLTSGASTFIGQITIRSRPALQRAEANPYLAASPPERNPIRHRRTAMPLNPAPSRRAASKTEQILFLTLVSQRKSWAS